MRWLSGRLVLWSFVLLTGGCQVFRGDDETTDSGTSGTTTEGMGGSGAGTTGGAAGAKVCTPEEEVGLLFEQEITDACPKVLNGPHTAPARNAVYPGDAVSVRVTFEQGALTTFEGAACRAASSGKKDSEFGPCKQYFVCGCCMFELGRSGGGATIEPTRISSGESCSPDFPMNTDYEVRGPSGGGAGGMGGMPGIGGARPTSACDDCLSTCRGLSGCCSGVGCICESQCQVTSCAPNLTYCCGPFGGCYCSDSCPY